MSQTSGLRSHVQALMAQSTSQLQSTPFTLSQTPGVTLHMHVFTEQSASHSQFTPLTLSQTPLFASHMQPGAGPVFWQDGSHRHALPAESCAHVMGLPSSQVHAG